METSSPIAPLLHQLPGPGKGGVGGGDGAAIESSAAIGAGPDHAVGFLQGVAHGFLGEDPLGAQFCGLGGEKGPALGIDGHGHDIELLLLHHLHAVGIEGLDAVAFAKGLEPFPVAVGAGHQLHFRTIPQRFGIGGGESFISRVVVVVEAPVDVQLGRGPVGVIHIEAIGDALRQVVEQSHPAQADHPGPIPALSGSGSARSGSCDGRRRSHRKPRSQSRLKKVSSLHGLLPSGRRAMDAGTGSWPAPPGMEGQGIGSAPAIGQGPLIECRHSMKVGLFCR